MEDNIDVKQLREARLKKMEADVNRAFDNRKQENYQPETKSTLENIEEAKQQKGWFEGLTDDAVVEVGEYRERANRASVENPHEYKDLLTFALKKLAQEDHLDHKDIQKGVEDILEHEFEHHTPALDHEGLKVRYCVEFSEDKGKEWMGIRPSIVLSGTMQIGVYKDVIGGAKQQSATDKIIR